MKVFTITGLLLREYQRNVLLLALLLVVPIVFITVSIYTTEDIPLTFLVRDGGERVSITKSMIDVHGAIMVAITAAFLASLVGLFTMLGAARSDSRLMVAGASPFIVTGSRLALIVVLSLAVTLVSIGVALVDFRPQALGTFVAANLLIGVTYALIGALAALVVGRLGGAYLMFTLPMIDIGIYQDPMLVSGEQPLWMKLLPGFGGTRLVLDAGFTSGFDEWTALAAALAWLVVLFAAVIYVISSVRHA
jgi:hypothetical protein